MAASEPNIVVALASFVAGVNGKDVVVLAGSLFRANDPVVKKLPQFFSPQGAQVSDRIEQATAAPGEKRGA